MAGSWEQREGESPKAYKAFLIYRDLGAGRSIDAAYRLSSKVQQEDSKRAARIWFTWARNFEWVARAQAWDKYQQEERDRIAREAEEAEIQRIMSLRYAKMHYRLEDLNEVAMKLKEELGEVDKVWLPDVKQIGSGRDAERVDIVRFNAPLYEKWYQALDDIAAELGQRERKSSVNVNFPQPPKPIEEMTLEELEAYDRELKRYTEARRGK